MATYQPGTNRARVFDLLSETPQTAQTIATALGLTKQAVNGVLNQIGALGDAVIVSRAKGNNTYARGNGVAPPPPPPSTKSKRGSAAHEKFDNYIKKNIGKVFGGAELIVKLGISPAFGSRKYAEAVKNNVISMIPDTRPRKYIINGPQQTELIPTLPPQSPPQQLMPETDAPIHTGEAIRHLMRVESQELIHRQALQQILAVYEQLGNVLEIAGLLEEE